MNRDDHVAALEAELAFAHAGKRRAERRIEDIEAELRRIRGDAPETATAEPAPERAVPQKPKRAE